MPIVVGVKFNGCSKVYYFDPEENTYNKGDKVVVETSKGAELAEIEQPNKEVTDEEIKGELKKITRRAGYRDFESQKRSIEMQPRCLKTAEEKAAQLNVPLRFVSCEVSFDCRKITLYFTADGRVDFRDLVKELASALHARIDLRQVMERDEVKLIGALGMCGRACCCCSHLKEFNKVSVKMAKVQGLSLNPAKISGLCGKLLCCLKYENEYYSEVFKLMPKVNSKVMTPDGPAVVDSNDMLKKICTCKVFVDDTFVIKKYPVEEVKRIGKQPDPEPESPDDDKDTIE